MKKALTDCLLGVVILLSFLTGCASPPDRAGKGSVSPSYDTSVPPGSELEKVSVVFSPRAQSKSYTETAVVPFQAPVELAGPVIADIFTTELLLTKKYRIAEKRRVEKALEKEGLDPGEDTDSALAVQLGQALGVEGVIVGSVPEYGMRAVGPKELPAVGLNIRMIDAADGTVVWSVSHSGVSPEPMSLPSFAESLVRLTVARLQQEWVRTGDRLAADTPAPQVASYEGGLRSARLEVLPDPAFVSYRFYRSRSLDGFYEDVATLRSPPGEGVTFTDKDLQDLETYHYKVAGVTESGLTGIPAGPFEVTTAGPPPAVGDFTAQSEIIRKIPLSWTPLTDPHVKGYRIFRRRGDGKWTEVKTLKKSGAASYTDTRLDDGVTYEYRIIAFNRANMEGPPAGTTATTKGPPSPVRSLEALGGKARQVPLTWEPVQEPEVKGYAVYRADREAGPWKQISRIEGRERGEYLDRAAGGFWRSGATLKDQTEYFYKIRALNVVDVESGDSPVVSAVTKPAPAAVSSFAAGQLEARQVSLRWQLNPEPDIERYDIFRGGEPSSVKTRLGSAPSTETGYIDKGVKDGTTYYYKVRAVDADGLIGEFSHAASSRTKPVPRKPEGLMAVEDGESVIVTWHENPERDIASYTIIKKGFLSTEVLGTSDKPPFIFSPAKGGTLRLRIKAVDADGLESALSDEFRIKVRKRP